MGMERNAYESYFLRGILTSLLVKYHLSRKNIHGQNWVCIFIILHCFKRQTNVPMGAVSSHAWLAIFIYILGFCEDITEKKTLIIVFNDY